MSISKSQTILAFLIAAGGLSSIVQAVEGSVRADYNSAFVQDDPVMNFGLKIKQDIPLDLTLSVAQSVDYNLVVDASKEIWEWTDTVIAIERSLKSGETLTFKSRLSTSLPTSIESRHDELYTRPELRISVLADLPAGVSSTTSLSFARYFHRFDATRMDGQTEGGEALPIYTYALAQEFSATVYGPFDVGIDGSYRVKRYYDLKEEGSIIRAENRVEDYTYSVGLSATYNYSDKTSLTASYGQGSGLERDDYSDFVVFDREKSTWNFSLVQLW